MLLTPTNGAVLDDVVPRDAFEKAVVDEFNKRVSDGVDSWDVREWAMREVRQHRQQQQQSPKPVAPPLPQTAPVRVSKEDEREQKCLVGPYAEIEKACRASGGETHHIVPDMVYRLGGRPTSAAGMTSTADRIPNAPTFNQGASICLTSGEHRTDEEAVHRTLNPALHELGAVK